VDGRGGAAVTVTVVVAEPQTVPSQTETRTCRVPAAAKVPATVNVLPVSANGFAPEPSSRSAVAAQVSVPGSANDPVSDHALPTSTVDVTGSVTVGATFATVSFAVSETTGLLPSSAVRVSVAVASSAHRTVVLDAAGSAMVHAASSTDQVAGADAVPLIASAVPSVPLTSDPASTDTVTSSSVTRPVPYPSATTGRRALVERSRPSTSRNVSTCTASATLSATTWTVTCRDGCSEESSTVPLAAATSGPTSAVPPTTWYGTVAVSPLGSVGVETVKVIGVVVPAGPEPSATAASETDSGSTSSSCSVTVPVASPDEALTGSDSSTDSTSSGSTLRSPTTERCSTADVSPAGTVTTPWAAAKSAGEVAVPSTVAHDTW